VLVALAFDLKNAPPVHVPQGTFARNIYQLSSVTGIACELLHALHSIGRELESITCYIHSPSNL